MNTLFLLMAEFGRPAVPLEDICKRYFNLDREKAYQKAAQEQLPVPTYRAGTQKSPRLVNLVDLAAHLDSKHQEATEEWMRRNVV